MEPTGLVLAAALPDWTLATPVMSPPFPPLYPGGNTEGLAQSRRVLDVTWPFKVHSLAEETDL